MDFPGSRFIAFWQACVAMNDKKPSEGVFSDWPVALASDSMDGKSLSLKISDLLARTDLPPELFRQKIADVLAESADGIFNTQLREVNQNLVLAALGAQDQQEQAESAKRRQDEFLSMFAHELRNPLAPISLSTIMLGQLTKAHPDLPKLHRIIDRQVNHLARLVDDLLDAARVSSGNITLEKRLMSLTEVIESAAETSRPFIDQRKHRLAIQLPQDLVVIDADPVRLTQVFANLLINAAKFTPEQGRITVMARVQGDSVAISVKDNGEGVPLDSQPFIFDLFQQAPQSLGHRQGGLGIGLSLVRTIVVMHGGTVEVRSAGAGLGSEFTVVLPISIGQIQADDKPATPAVSPTPRRILVIEDNVDANETLSDWLTMQGHSVASAFNGISGLAKARDGAFETVICDVGLPGMSGYEVISQLRLDGMPGQPNCIAITGYGHSESRRLAMEAGFDHFLVKPIAADTLMNLISSPSPPSI